MRPRVLDVSTLTGMAEQRLRTNATVVPIGRTTTNVTLPLQTLALALSQLVGAQEQIDLATKAHPEVLCFLPNVTGFRLVPVSFLIAGLVNSAALGVTLRQPCLARPVHPGSPGSGGAVPGAAVA